MHAHEYFFTGDDQEASPNREEQVVGNKSYAPQSTKRHVSRREAPFSYTLQQRSATDMFLFYFHPLSPILSFAGSLPIVSFQFFFLL